MPHKPQLYTPLSQRNTQFANNSVGGSLEDIKRGIAYVETRNAPDSYSIQGKPRPSDGKRALGKYQVFETNLPTWTKEALGREYSKDEFLADPQAQEKVADHFMGKSLQQYGNPEDVASVWFTGRPVAKANNAADYTGTDNATYQELFKKGMGIVGGVASSAVGAAQKYIPLAARKAGNTVLDAFDKSRIAEVPGKTVGGLRMIGGFLGGEAPAQNPIRIGGARGFDYTPPNIDPTGAVGFTERVGAKAVQPIATAAFEGFQDLSTKLLEKLKGRTTVSKQFLLDSTNQADLKQPEKDLFRRLLESEGDTVSVSDFANKVQGELLPLKRVGASARDTGDFAEMAADGEGYRYENITLPSELRGPVQNYSEHIYESPIKTSAGQVHFGGAEKGNAESYFAHSRVEDLPDLKAIEDTDGSYLPGTTRRVIEIQSDLFQKGRLENENPRKFDQIGATYSSPGGKARVEAEVAARDAELAKLEPYRNTWHERVIREEVKQAALDGKTKLQFPTGETAMKIEGLGERGAGAWVLDNGSNPLFSDLKAGKTIYRSTDNNGMGTRPFGEQWIITDVLGDGKFKAVPKDKLYQIDSEEELYDVLNNSRLWSMVKDDEVLYSAMEDIFENGVENADTLFAKYDFDDLATRLRKAEVSKLSDSAQEQFDISGKVDTENPIYKFYEKNVQKYLTNKYGGKVITDPQGVKWVEIDVKPEYKGLPVEAFGAAIGIPSIYQQVQEQKEQGNI